MNTRTFYNGPSSYDGEQIVAVASCLKSKSRNAKTGDMAQVALMVSDIDPQSASNLGLDISVCGGCLMRPTVRYAMVKRGDKTASKYACYVTKFRMMAQWKKATAMVPDLQATIDALSTLSKPVRFGQYGNMSALPQDVGEAIMGAPKRHTGYDHAWKDEANQWTAPYLMASCQNLSEAKQAQDIGYRTFRVIPKDVWEGCKGEPLQKNEILCPATTHGITCAKCLLCNGKTSDNDKRKNIAIVEHA